MASSKQAERVARAAVVGRRRRRLLRNRMKALRSLVNYCSGDDVGPSKWEQVEQSVAAYLKAKKK